MVKKMQCLDNTNPKWLMLVYFMLIKKFIMVIFLTDI